MTWYAVVSGEFESRAVLLKALLYIRLLLFVKFLGIFCLDPTGLLFYNFLQFLAAQAVAVLEI